MKNIILGLGLGAILLASSVVDAKTTSSYKTKGNGAYGSIEKISDCGYISIYVEYNEYATKDGPGKPTSSKSICFTMIENNYCNDDFIYSSKWACDIPGSVSGNINKGISLSVDGTVVLHSYTYSNGNEEWEEPSIDLQLQADWAPIGSVSTGRNTYRNFYPNYRYISRYSGASRDADFDLSAYVDGNNVIPSSPEYIWGYLFKSTDGSICHGECY
jgi:hypothetical protein